MLPLLKDTVSKINKITDTALEEEFVSHQKPKLQDAPPIDQRTRLELEQLLIGNSDCFAEDEHQLGTTPLITMPIDTGDHPCCKRPYTLALKHHNWVKAEIDKLLEAGVIRGSDSSWSAPIVVVPKGDGGKRLCIDVRALNYQNFYLANAQS